ncbi:MAG: hypothetical protein IJ774_04540 [Selenomonadaceae bacterium]|nr:hypothetical protein [Selenomonadaceae bacterium]
MKHFLRQRDKNFFGVRVKSSGGNFTATQLGAIQTLAETFGRGQVHLTSRQEISVPFIAEENFAAVENFCAVNGLELCTNGATLKTVTTCQGSEICRFGLIDAPKIAREIEGRHANKIFPAKFTVGVTGCPHNCMKVDANDIGIVGAGKFKILFGGREFLTVRDEDTLFEIVDAAINFFTTNARKGERLKDFLARIGVDEFTKHIRCE